MGTIGQDVSKSVKKTAKGSGKKVLQEPLEILKAAGSQVTSSESSRSEFDSKYFYEKSDRKEEDITNQQKDEIEAKRRKMLADLEAEIDAIRKEREEKDRKRKEAFIAQQDKLQQEKVQAVPEVATKRSRKLKAGMSGKLDKLKRKSEIRMPPSG